MTWNQYKLDFITSHRMSWHRIRPIMSCGRRRWGLTRLHDNELEDWRDIEKQCWSNTSSSTHVMLQMSPCTTRWRSIFLVLVREPYLLSSPLLSSPLRAWRTDILTLGTGIRQNFRGLSTIKDCSLNSNNDSHLKSKVIASVVHVSCDWGME